MKNRLIVAGTISAFAILAGCQSTTQNASNPQVQLTPATPKLTPAPNSAAALNGNWIPTDEAAKGVYVAEFRDGQFVSRSPTTKKPLAKGKYNVVSDTVVNLNFVGAATNTAVEAKCDRKSPTTMYCVPSVGSPFNLSRT